MTGLFDALNVVYEEKEQRSLSEILRNNPNVHCRGCHSCSGVDSYYRRYSRDLKLYPKCKCDSDIAGYRQMAAFVCAGRRGARYRLSYGPCRSSPQWRWIIWSAAFAALVWLGVSALFSWYVANFGSYNKTYGSLGAIFGFMTWMWLSMVVVLVGAKLNAQLERSFRS